MSKMSLTEATILALQGKLTEDVEVETNEAQVTVAPDKTVINSAEAQVTVEQPAEVVVTEPETTEEIATEVDTNVDTNVDTMVDDKPVESEVEDTVEEITESKKLQEDDDDEDDEDDEEVEETTAEEVVEEPESEESEEAEPVEDQLSAIDEAVAKIKDMINALPEEVKSEIFKCEDCTNEEVTDEVPEIEETTEEVVEEPIDELEECDKFNSATFNEVLTKYYNKQNKKVEKFELTKLLKNKNTLKVEGKLINSDKTTKDIKLEMKQVQRGTKFGRYEVKTNKKVESVRGKQIMMVSASNKVLNCNYMINKK